jgi:hypothetical protein
MQEREEEPEPDNAAMRAALSAWRRKSLHALKAGKSPATVFEHEAIGPDLHADIWAKLSACKTAADVREVFEQAIAGGDAAKGDSLLSEKVEALEAMVKKSAWVMYP